MHMYDRKCLSNVYNLGCEYGYLITHSNGGITNLSKSDPSRAFGKKKALHLKAFHT